MRLLPHTRPARRLRRPGPWWALLSGTSTRLKTCRQPSPRVRTARPCPARPHVLRHGSHIVWVMPWGEPSTTGPTARPGKALCIATAPSTDACPPPPLGGKRGGGTKLACNTRMPVSSSPAPRALPAWYLRLPPPSARMESCRVPGRLPLQLPPTPPPPPPTGAPLASRRIRTADLAWPCRRHARGGPQLGRERPQEGRDRELHAQVRADLHTRRLRCVRCGLLERASGAWPLGLDMGPWPGRLLLDSMHGSHSVMHACLPQRIRSAPSWPRGEGRGRARPSAPARPHARYAAHAVWAAPPALATHAHAAGVGRPPWTHHAMNACNTAFPRSHTQTPAWHPAPDAAAPARASHHQLASALYVSVYATGLALCVWLPVKKATAAHCWLAGRPPLQARPGWAPSACARSWWCSRVASARGATA